MKADHMGRWVTSGGGGRGGGLGGGGEVGWSRMLDSCCTGPLCCNHKVEDEDDNDDHDDRDDNDDHGDNDDTGDNNNGEDDNGGDIPAPAIAVPILGIKANIGCGDQETTLSQMITSFFNDPLFRFISLVCQYIFIKGPLK